MRGALPQTQQFYAEISSQFVPASSSGGAVPSAIAANTSSASAAKAAAALDAHVSQAVNGITTGALSAMVEGEKPAVVVTTNIRATMQSQIVTNKTMAPLAPPQSEEEAQYGAPQPVIQVVGSNILKCNFGGGYAQMASVQFGSNPHQGSTSITSPLLQFVTRSTTKIPKSVQIATAVSASFAALAVGGKMETNQQHRQMTHKQVENEEHRPEAERRKLREQASGAGSPPSPISTIAPSSSHIPSLRPSYATPKKPSVEPTRSPTTTSKPTATPKPTSVPTISPTNFVPIPAYYVSLPLTGNKHYNVTQYRLSKGRKSFSNYSIPACSLYLGGKYVSCGSCNISSFTMVNVTYGCYDITYLCPVTVSTSVTSRRLEMDDEPGMYHRNGGGTLDVGGPLDEDEMDVSVDGPGYDFNDASGSYAYLSGDSLGYRQHRRNVTANEEEVDEDEEGQEATFSGHNGLMQALNDTNTSYLSDHLTRVYRQLRNSGGGGSGGIDSSQKTSHAIHDDLITNTFNSSNLDGQRDDAPKNDDTYTLKSFVRVTEFGALLEYNVAKLESVLSLNFSQIDLAKAAPVLAFVVSLTAVWLLGSLFFLQWDKSDRHRLVYLREYHVKAAYKMIKDDILQGGTGVIDGGDAASLGAATLHEQINRTLDVLKTSLSPKQFFNPHKSNSIYAGTKCKIYLLFSPGIYLLPPPPPLPQS